MSEQENLQTVKRFYKLVSDRDLPAVLRLVTDDVDWKDGGSGRPWNTWSTWCHGREEFERYGSKLFEALEVRAFRPDEFIFSRDSVVVLGYGQYFVRAISREVDSSWVQVFFFRGGLICKFREYSDSTLLEAGVAKE